VQEESQGPSEHAKLQSLVRVSGIFLSRNSSEWRGREDIADGLRESLEGWLQDGRRASSGREEGGRGGEGRTGRAEGDQISSAPSFAAFLARPSQTRGMHALLNEVHVDRRFCLQRREDVDLKRPELRSGLHLFLRQLPLLTSTSFTYLLPCFFSLISRASIPAPCNFSSQTAPEKLTFFSSSRSRSLLATFVPSSLLSPSSDTPPQAVSPLASKRSPRPPNASISSSSNQYSTNPESSGRARTYVRLKNQARTPRNLLV